MKRKLGVDLPSWYTWSDGRALSANELKKFRFLRKRTQQKGESWRQWFERVRAPIERYEAAMAKATVKRPGLLARACAWLRGRQVGPFVELKP
jgi:hypothetical protein